MGSFKDAEHLYLCIGGLLEMAKSHQVMAKKVNKSGIAFTFKYDEPVAEITIDTKAPEAGESYVVHCGPWEGKAEIVMSMKADTAHLFWMGKINLMAALAKGQIVSKGPINKALALLPAIKPAYTMYPEHLKKLGMEELIV